jgi:hypothetical protein
VAADRVEGRAVIRKVVSRFEANLLLLLRFFLRRVPADQALPLLAWRAPRPRCLSRAAVELVQDTLAKGCPFLLARSGGWHRERHLRGSGVVEGRLWQRTPPAELALDFSGHTLRFLIWITAAGLPDGRDEWSAPEEELTLADRLLLFYAYGAVRHNEALAARLRARASPLRRHGLCRLAFPEDFLDQEARPDFEPWTAGLGACVLEAVQPELTTRWLDIERSKRRIADWRRMRALGQSQGRVLDAFLGALEGADRRDLARFLLRTLTGLLGDRPTAEDWTAALQVGLLRLADRLDAYRAALAVLRQVDRLRQWEQRARQVGYFDEGYAASQLWKADWEAFQGETLVERAGVIVRELEPFSGPPTAE